MTFQLLLLQITKLQSLPAAEPSTEPLWRLILSGIPRDASAIMVYTLIAFCVGLIWWGHRKSGRTAEAVEGTSPVNPEHEGSPSGHQPAPPPQRPGRAA